MEETILSDDKTGDESVQRQQPLVTSGKQKQTSKVVKAKTPSKNSKAWRKPKDMPRRPLSAYNFFFQSERRKLLAEADAAEQAAIGQIGEASAVQRPNRLGFADLARAIAKAWKGIDDETKAPFKQQARIDKVRYKRELKIWNKTFESDEESDEEEPSVQPSAEQQRTPTQQQQVADHERSVSYFQMAQRLNPSNMQAQFLGNQPLPGHMPLEGSTSRGRSHHNRQQMHQSDNPYERSGLIGMPHNPMNLAFPPSNQETTPTALDLYHAALAAARRAQLMAESSGEASPSTQHLADPPTSSRASVQHSTEPPTASQRAHPPNTESPTANNITHRHIDAEDETAHVQRALAPTAESQQQEPQVSLDESWLDLAGDLMMVPCDICNSPSEHDCHSYRHSEIDNDIVAMMRGVGKSDVERDQL